MSCEAENLAELKAWLDELEQSGRRAVAALRSTHALNRVGAHLNGRASFALSFARRALDDVADYLTDWSAVAEGSPEQMICESLQRADEEFALAEIDASIDELRGAFSRARLLAVPKVSVR